MDLTQLLLRLFVKDYRNTEDPAVRTRYGKLAGIVGIVCNVLLSAGKLLAGTLSGAVSITADGLNNLTDAASSLVTLLGFRLAEQYGFTFVGGHPMAGTQFSGFANSKADMFDGAPMVVVPPQADDILLLDRVKKLLTPAGFAHLTVTTAEHHDEMIAYTSQMCHVISNAYVKSPRAQMHKGYSAGSYMDLTRVAWLNEHMWTDLFLENRTFLLQELDQMISSLQEYREALEQGNGDRLCTLLAEGRICKEKVDGQ